MARVKLTSGRIASFHCPKGKTQAFMMCAEVSGLGIRATIGSDRKRYIFESRVNGRTMRTTIGDVSGWTIPEAQAEARRLQVLIDQGKDPRQVAIDEAAAKVAAKNEKEAVAANLIEKQIQESIIVSDAWKAYVQDRSSSIKDGKPEWGEKHKAHLASFVQEGGKKRTRGRRPNEPDTTRPGILVPLMNVRLVDLTEAAISSWLDKEVAQAPTSTAQAFRALSSFLVWCSKQEKYRTITNSELCKSENIKKRVPSPKTKKYDSLRRAQIKPWFEAVQKIGNPIIANYLQCLLLTGARRNELSGLRWEDLDFKWKSMNIRDKVEGDRTIPLTPYVEKLIISLPRRKLTKSQKSHRGISEDKSLVNDYVFSSATSKSVKLEEPRNPHNSALQAAELPSLSLHGLRRSFGTLSEWVEVPAGIVAQIMGHKPSAIAEKHYIQRELDLLHLWHVKIESWILGEANIQFSPAPFKPTSKLESC